MTDQPQYKPGDVANGYRLNEQQQWVPLDPASKPTPGNATPAPGSTSTTEKPKGKVGRRLLIGVAGAALFFIGIGIGGAGKSTPATTAGAVTTATVTTTATVSAQTVTAPPETVTVTAPPTTPPPVAGPATKVSTDGVFVVGKDIAAGKWRTPGPAAGDPPGYFAILKDPTGSTSDISNIVTNDNPTGQAFATLKDGQGLSTQRLTWEKIG